MALHHTPPKPPVHQTLLTRRRVAGGALAAGAALAWARWAQAAETLLVPPPYRQQDLEWWDNHRQRAVPVRVYAPLNESVRAHPLVVFSHGIGGSRTGYGYLGRYLASQGVASLHLQHVGSDRQVWMGNPFQVVSRLQSAAQEAEAIDRVRDLKFALDEALDGRAGLVPDAQRIIAAGHSYGANTALLASGAEVLRQGQRLSLRDERIRAAVLLSAPPFYGEAALGSIVGGIALPSLHITTTDDVIRIPGFFSGLEDRLKVFEAMGSAQKWLAVFQGGSHSHFVGRRGEGDPLLQATRELVLAFVQQVFDGNAQGLQAWPQRHAGLLAQFAAKG
ncbi:MAG: alpha/beta hydrolase family protein [Rubrivivax sp.]|jgi:predicted dienelactone hydrolase